MANIEDFRRLVAGDHGLVVVSATRDDGTISSSVVNAGVLPHPVTGETVVGMVVARRHPEARLLARAPVRERRHQVRLAVGGGRGPRST